MDALERAWTKQWPATNVGSHRVGDYHDGTFVEFHRLPTQRRRAEIVVEYAESLHRSRALLTELLQANATSILFAVTRSWSKSSMPDSLDERDSWLRHFVPAVYWRSYMHDPGESDDPIEFPAMYEHMYISEVTLNDPALLSLILLAANDQAAYPVFFTADVSWVLSPCDEGAHLAVADLDLVARLKQAFPDWLGKLNRVGIPQPAFETNWGVSVTDVTESEARAVLDLVQESGLLAISKSASLDDPQAAVRPHLDRRDAQLLRIALSDEAGSVFTPYDQSTRSVTPSEARAEIWDEGLYFDQLVGFLDVTGYRDPAEAMGGRLDRRLWNPNQDYSGIDGDV
jgi:hypothetical protein